MDVKQVLSFGAGVQSTTLLLMSLDGVLPKLDHVIFADTQWEPRTVYDHLAWCQRIAQERAGLKIDICTAGNIRHDLIDAWGPKTSSHGNRCASIPWFMRNDDGSTGMIRRQCTSEYKINVIERYVREEVLGLKHRQRWPKQHTVTQWIGISADEAGRMKRSLRQAQQFWHPLIEADACAVRDSRYLFARGMTRTDCLEWLTKRGYPIPPKSACIGCPFHSDAEWKRLTPAEFRDACAVEKLIQIGATTSRENVLRALPYLHRSCVPLEKVTFRDDDNGGWHDECAGVCGV